MCVWAILGASPSLAETTPPDPAPPPISPAQHALFETPHLANVAKPETLEYQFTQMGPSGFTDRVDVTVAEIHPDGTKDLRFDFLTGERHVVYPGIARFSANPLLMLFLEYDVRQMNSQTGMSAAYFRDRVRQSFVDGAVITDGTTMVNGEAVPAKTIVVQPFANDPRFGRIKVISGKTYTFVVSPDVPGGLAALRTDAPADPSIGAPALGNAVAFASVRP